MKKVNMSWIKVPWKFQYIFSTFFQLLRNISKNFIDIPEARRYSQNAWKNASKSSARWQKKIPLIKRMVNSFLSKNLNWKILVLFLSILWFLNIHYLFSQYRKTLSLLTAKIKMIKILLYWRNDVCVNYFSCLFYALKCYDQLCGQFN